MSSQSQPFVFPRTQSDTPPDPSTFFSAVLPTNSFFQNLVLNQGDEIEYIHPYIIKAVQSSLVLCYPAKFGNALTTGEVYIADLTVSTLNNPSPNMRHVISSFDDLSVTVDFPSNNLQAFLVRGSPFLTFNVMNPVELSISTIHDILEFSSNTSATKYKIKLNNNQTWLIYSSKPVFFCQNASMITSTLFSGVIRISALPNLGPKVESLLDKYRYCYPVSGQAVFTDPFTLTYEWNKAGHGDLLMLAHPLHRQLLSDAIVLDDFKYNSIDGELVGIVGDSWVLKVEPTSITWHSLSGIDEGNFPEIIEALEQDVYSLDASIVNITNLHLYGVLLARGARLALIAEEVGHTDVVPVITEFLKKMIEPWLEGTFDGNGFVYDPKWGGILSKNGSLVEGADFGFGLYHNHHFSIGYFVYVISVLTGIDATWGENFKSRAYSLVSDYMNLSRETNSKYTRLRNFDLWKLHSWASGLQAFVNGRNQESSSDAVNAYYSAALMGKAYADKDLESVGSTITALEIQAAKTWWHVRKDDNIYPEEFTRENRMVGVLWSTQRESYTWTAPSGRRESRLGVQLLPIVPITETLFSDVNFVRQLVGWTLPALNRNEAEKWKGCVYALQGVYDRAGALINIYGIQRHDDGNSLTNLLWWIYSRPSQQE